MSPKFYKSSRARMMVATLPANIRYAAGDNQAGLATSGSAQVAHYCLATEGAVAVLYLFVLRLSAPESPHWLMSRGKFAEAAQAHSDNSRATTGSVRIYR